jgi:hypothetical protein
MTPDHTKQCNHIDLLLNTPSKEELSVLRKGLRKMKLPEIPLRQNSCHLKF